MNKFNFTLAFCWNFFYAVIRKFVGRDKFRRFFYYGQKIKDQKFTNDFIASSIQSGNPFMVARYGDVELRTVVYTIQKRMGWRNKVPERIKKILSNNAGFFPATDENMFKFGDVMLEASKSVDLFATWYNIMEDYVIHYTSPKSELCVPEFIDPFRSSDPWTKALKGKKVLVVHPFSESIQKQYQIREKLYDNPKMLPEFELITYKAIQTQAGETCEFATWFDALDKMFSDIEKLDFDIAILGCGAYGFPLAAKIKNIGKQAIHLGGATQILFGIKGARWEAKPEVSKLFNEYWVRPSESERPKNANRVENACYW